MCIHIYNIHKFRMAKDGLKSAAETRADLVLSIGFTGYMYLYHISNNAHLYFPYVFITPRDVISTTPINN